ncbi:hypothetical protein [Desmospora activa]|uniref:Uncharacterized protein n=1 Tax=Desmospora activa DSM 45169 TaxID=1121389 RepID=A0A2T4ZCL7_9BACL|nr:hypothetical protein [Desmospora activa]PTM59635.1 hypothetical protein C8J48_2264 [Desmospora activa DSM 45169]
MLRCPNCNTHDLGRIGTHQYYCWGCFIECHVVDGTITSVYQVEEDGSLSSLNDLFLESGQDTVSM